MWFLALLAVPAWFVWRNRPAGGYSTLGTSGGPVGDNTIGPSDDAVAQSNVRGSGTGSALPLPPGSRALRL